MKLKCLCILIVTVALSAISLVWLAPAYACDSLEVKINGDCPPHAKGRSTGTEVQLEADREGRLGIGNDRDAGPPRPPNKNTMTYEQRAAYEDQLAREAAAAGGYYRPEFWTTFVGTPPTLVTMSDIASFRPTVGGNHMEPNGWIVVGLPTNFYSDSSAQVVNGTLLGLPASVRFTARSWNWSYGDGASKSSPTPGASWAAQNLAEFESTSTSHVFVNPGTYTIDLSVEYSAEYQFGNRGWVPIDGSLVVPTNRIVATAGDAKTVLVNRDCNDNSEGPGC